MHLVHSGDALRQTGRGDDADRAWGVWLANIHGLQAQRTAGDIGEGPGHRHPGPHRREHRLAGDTVQPHLPAAREPAGCAHPARQSARSPARCAAPAVLEQIGGLARHHRPATTLTARVSAGFGSLTLPTRRGADGSCPSKTEHPGRPRPYIDHVFRHGQSCRVTDGQINGPEEARLSVLRHIHHMQGSSTARRKASREGIENLPRDDESARAEVGSSATLPSTTSGTPLPSRSATKSGARG